MLLSSQKSEVVSICIPTYNRPKMLEQAVKSCLLQTYPFIQVVISDDSNNNDSQKIIQEKFGFLNIKYKNNEQSLGQASNVNQCFDMADGQRLILLHDDDILLPKAVEILDKVWRNNPNIVVCYGNQRIVDSAGKELCELSPITNFKYFRTPENEGLQSSEIWAAMIQQFPNDGFMISTDVAQKVRMNPAPNIGSACDHDFALRVAQSYKGFYYINTDVSLYRLTEISITSGKLDVHYTFNLLQNLTLPKELDKFRRLKLNQIAPVAVNRWLLQGQRVQAAKIYFSVYYPFLCRLSVKGIVQLILLIMPFLLTKAVFRLRKNDK